MTVGRVFSVNTQAQSQRIAQLISVIEQLRAASRTQEAEILCRQALEMFPQAPGILNSLGLLVRDRGGYDEAETLLQRALVAAPREASLHNNLGNVLHAKGDLPGAVASYRRAIGLKGDYPEPCYNLGTVLREQGLPEQALSAQRRAVALRPHYAEALVQLGVLLSEAGSYGEALEFLDRAVAANRRYYDACYYRGAVLARMERWDEAIVAQRSATSLAPHRYEAWHALGNALANSGNDDAALDAYRRATEVAPEFLPAHRAFNTIAWTLGRADLHLSTFAVARKRVGQRPELLLCEAGDRLRLGQHGPAETLLRDALALAPESAEVRNLLARALNAQGRYADGVVLLEEAVRREPDRIEHRKDLGIALLQVGDSQAARDVLEAARLLAPCDQLVLAHLALAYRATADSRLGPLVDFKQYIGIFDLTAPSGYAGVGAFNEALAEDLMALHTSQVEPLYQTLRGGTQTTGDLFKSPARAVQLIREKIAEAAKEYIHRLPNDAEHPFLSRKDAAFDFATSWSCRLRNAGFHANHVHPMGWISSAYYVSVPDAVTDDADRQGWIKFGESNLGLGDIDRAELAIRPIPGRLVLFPSYFWHGTVPFHSNDHRLTIAFDIIPQGLGSSGPETIAL